MDPLLLGAFFFFALSSTITPGPNNIMMMASGARFGFRRTIPHMLGVAFGFPAMVLAAGLGLGALLQHSALLHQVVRIVGAAFMVWMAYAIAFAPRAGEKKVEGKDRPMRFFEAVLFQWVNAKAWTMGMGAIAAYTKPENPLLPQILTIVGIFTLVGIPSAMIWTAFGKAIRHFLGTPLRERIFNVVMGGLLFLSVLPIIIDVFKGH